MAYVYRHIRKDTNAVEVYNGTSWVNVGNAGDIINISGLIIALPGVPEDVYARDKKHADQYWERFHLSG